MSYFHRCLKRVQYFLFPALLLFASCAQASWGGPGPYPVVTETYGSWTGGPNVTTDIRDYFDSPSTYVTGTLGITMDAVPLRARVYRPSLPGIYPILFILHGNHDPAEPSFEGYAYLQQHLASYGYIVVSPDEDFLNGAFGEMDARAIVLLRHIQLWRQWSTTVGHPYFNKVNMNRIGLMGHSRGGEAVVVAKKFNTIQSTPYWPPNWFNFNIGPLFGIAPTDKLILTDTDPYAMRLYFSDPGFPLDPQRSTPISTDDSAYGVIQGSHDDDIVFFVGQNQYERAQPVTGAATKHKSAFFLFGANHKHFNSVWAAPCVPAPQSPACADSASQPRPLNKLITPAQSQQTLKVFATAFMRHNLLGLDTRDVLTQRVPDSSLPAGVTVMSRYQDKDRLLLDHYQEDDVLTTGSLAGVSNMSVGLAQFEELYLLPSEIWFFGFPLVYADYPHTYLATDAALLAWDGLTDQYRLNFASTLTVGPQTANYPYLSFDMGQFYERTPDKNTVDVDQNLSISVQLENLFGVIVNSPPRLVSAYARLPYPDRVFQDGATTIDGDFTHNFLRTVRIPLSHLVSGTFLPPSRIRGVTFRFNQRPSGRVLVDNIQISK